ncbi:MAG: hypothetical protein AAF608_10145 [Pseudomonadota bacterium]
MIASMLVSLLATASLANEEFKVGCEAYMAEVGGTTDCACLAKKYDESAELAAAFEALTAPEEAASTPIVAEAIAACTP